MGLVSWCPFQCKQKKNEEKGNETEDAAMSENVMAGKHRAHKT